MQGCLLVVEVQASKAWGRLSWHRESELDPCKGLANWRASGDHRRTCEHRGCGPKGSGVHTLLSREVTPSLQGRSCRCPEFLQNGRVLLTLLRRGHRVRGFFAARQGGSFGMCPGNGGRYTSSRPCRFFFMMICCPWLRGLLNCEKEDRVPP